MQKILYSLLVIGIVSSIAVGSGAIAYFNDIEKSTGNTFAAGTLDLKVNGGDTSVTTVSVSNKVPGDKGNGSTALKNAGSISGELDIDMSTISETAGTSGEYAGGKDLATFLKMVLWLDVDQNGAFNSGDIELIYGGTCSPYNSSTNSALTYVSANKYGGNAWNAVETMVGGVVDGGAVDDFTISWKIPPTIPNVIQGDSMSFDVTFTLEQAGAD